jgi:carboxypeptidase D
MIIPIYKVTVLETYPQIINFDTDVYHYFKTQYAVRFLSVGALASFIDRQHICKYDLNLTYPQNKPFPSLTDPRQTVGTSGVMSSAKYRNRFWNNAITQNFAKFGANSGLSARDADKREKKRQLWKRGLTGRPNGTLDPYYGCFLWEEMFDYAVNFSFPWSMCFSLYREHFLLLTFHQLMELLTYISLVLCCLVV